MTATTAQKDFILSLSKSRVVPANIAEYIDQEWSFLTKQDASDLINTLKALPKQASSAARETMRALPKSKYAIPAGLLAGGFSQKVDDLLFVEVREYNGYTYMRRLYGSWGDFRRERMARGDEAFVVGVLAADPVRFAQEFGKHYARCGRCGAELTDEASRARFLGPDCAKALGML